MRFSSFAVLLGFAACAALSTGCGRSKTPHDAMSLLQSPDPDERKDAAKDLMDDDGPPPDAVPALITALQREQDPDTYGVILVALGKSGAPEAKPYLETNINNQNKSVRRSAEKALELWARKNPNGVPMPPPGAPPPPPADPANGPPPPPPPPAAPPPPPAQDPGQQI
jgi:hypothetical protein